MLTLFRAVIDRLKALFATSAALELEAEFLARHAERQAELLRQAARHDQEGFHGIAEQLRQQAEAISLQRPLASVLPSLGHWQAGHDTNAPLERSDAGDGAPTEPVLPSLPPVALKKRKGR